MTFGVNTKQFPSEIVGAVRTALIVTSIVGIVLGLVAVFWPGATTLVLAVLFGISLIIAGIFRIYQAFAASFLSGGARAMLGIVGVLTLVVGLIALFSPDDAVWLLALFIGIGWIFQGVHDLFGAASGSQHSPTWFLVLSGIVSVLAGIVMIILGQFAVTVVVFVGGIMLIVLSIATLCTLPKKVEGA
ncbi:HdeD family acid-resistance protein [Gordonia sp. DT30]|uniref:HdeD family acid-resistance protein n=1 Tax=unclassified Gordonia (in: high G+C Gram-positive bacteria) TaxID=2657482 RepID=UPI003CEC570A